MTMAMKLKVGDFYKCYGAWREVLAMGEPSPRFQDSEIMSVRLALPSKDLQQSILTTTYHQPATDDDIVKSNIVRTPDEMGAAVLDSFDGAIDTLGYSVFTGESLTSLFGKLNYGTINDYAEQVLKSEREYHHGSVKSWLSDNKVVQAEVPNYDTRLLVVNVYRPFKSELKDGNISLTRTAVDAKRDRQTSMKPGRAFRHMYPWLDDKSIARITEAWVEHSQPRELTLKVGKSASDFHRAYDHTRAEYRNPRTTYDRKSIASSCMQGVGRHYYDDGLETNVYASVGEAYASGDFAVAWLETTDGFIAGRVVYSDVAGLGRYNGPLYGACEQSLDELQTYLDSIDSGLGVDEWSGLKLAVVGDRSDPIVPYLDGGLAGDYYGDGFIKLSCTDGDLEFDNTDGTTSGGEVCNGCNDRLDENDAYYTDDGIMCEICFDDNYVHLECGTVIDRENAEYVHISRFRGFGQEWVCSDDAVYCEMIDQYWHVDDVVGSPNGDEWMPVHLAGEYPDTFPCLADDDDDADVDDDRVVDGIAVGSRVRLLNNGGFTGDGFVAGAEGRVTHIYSYKQSANVLKLADVSLDNVEGEHSFWIGREVEAITIEEAA